MNPWFRPVGMAVASLLLGVFLSWILLVATLHIPRSHVQPALAYLLGSAVTALLIGTVILFLISRFVPTLSLKIWTACIAGSAATMLVVLYTPYMMFAAKADFDLLRVSLLYSLFISLSLGLVVATLTTRQLRTLSTSAARIASGQFETRVTVRGSDEVAMLAGAFNQMASELGEMFDRKRQLEENRRDLIAAVSHDLRTPLTSIRAMVEAINDGVVSEPTDVRRYMGLIQGETERLGRLIDDLFELSRIESGNLDLRLATVPVGELVSETVEGLRIQAEERGIVMETHYDSDVPALLIDGPRMQRVLVNLIQNALRHTPPGGSISIRAGREDGHVRVVVADTGEGILPEDQPHIFEQFYRGEKSRSRESGGAGLGLAIARGIVEAHRGRLEVQSAPGQGATFVVTL